jgi:predicted transport protein
MPQNKKLVPAWRKMLGEGWQDIQREWLHRLGNLTLTGYNSSYSDRPFEDKKIMKGGFSESAVRLNKFVREQEQWTPAEMRRRSKRLSNRALEIWPMLTVEKALVDRARESEMRANAQRHDVSRVAMTPTARVLFEALRKRVQGIDKDVIEMAETKSVSYHGPTFFLEVLPRKNRILLLLPLEFNEVEDPSGIAEDTSQWKFLTNAQYEGGVHIPIREEADIDKALPIIRMAREVGKA